MPSPSQVIYLAIHWFRTWCVGYGLSYLSVFGVSTTGVFFPGSWLVV
jgi:hypothetical protein